MGTSSSLIDCRMSKAPKTIEPFLIWITGLAGSGKTTIATEVHRHLKIRMDNVVLVDGDAVRDMFGADLGHDPQARYENALRITRLCKFLVEEGISVVCSTMSLYSTIHTMNRGITPRYFEVFVDVPMEELVRRDKNRLYSRALQGEIEHVVGVDQAFDRPKNPHLTIDNRQLTALEDKAKSVVRLILEEVN